MGNKSIRARRSYKPETNNTPAVEASSEKDALEPQRHGALLGSCVLGSNKVAAACSDGSVIVYDVSSRSTRRVGAHTSSANRLAARGRHIYSCSRDLSLAQWRCDDDAAPVQRFVGHGLNVAALAVGDGELRLASGSRDTHVKIWDIPTGKEVSTRQIPRNVVTCMRWFHGDCFVQGSEDLQLRVWDSRTMKEPVQSFGKYVYFPLCVDVDVTNDLFCTGSKGFNGQGCEVRVWDRRKPAIPLAMLLGHSQDCTGVAFASAGQVASVSKDATIKLWDVKAQTELSETNHDAAGMFTGLEAAAQTTDDGPAYCATNFQGALFCLDKDLSLISTLPPAGD